jgi:hypothetical protein
MIYNTTELISRFRSSGLPQKQFCTAHSISLSTLQYHLQKAKQAPTDSSGGFISLSRPLPEQIRGTVVILRGDFTVSQIAQLVNACGER